MNTAQILLVDDDPGAIQLMARILSGSGHLRFATCGEDALKLAHEVPPDLVLLDAEMPGMSGFEVCDALKTDPKFVHVPVMFVTSHSEPEFELSGFECGAADFIGKPISEPVVLARVRTQLRLKQLHDELLRVSTIDALTGIANRRSFDNALEREWQRGLRAGTPISLLLIDVDHFKRFNDRHGHPAGDIALRAVAQTLSEACRRPADLVARYGGEEFVLLLPETPRAGAVMLAQRMLESIALMGLAHGDSPTAEHVTISVGVGCYDEESPVWLEPTLDSGFLREMDMGQFAGELVLAADQALYAAKRAGRARACCLDIADVTAPQMARSVVGRTRIGRTRVGRSPKAAV